jgi:hypothetical protein
MNTITNFDKADINEEYLGSRNAKWIKLDLNDYQDFVGKIYETI